MRGAATRLLTRLIAAGQSWGQDGGGLLAAAVAYSAGLSFFPAMLVLLSCVGFVARSFALADDARSILRDYIQSTFSPGLATQVDDVLGLMGEQAGVNGLVGWGVLLFSAGLLFAQFTAAFDRIWNVEADPDAGWWDVAVWFLKQRALAFVLLVVLGFVALAVAVIGLVLEAAHGWLPLSKTFWAMLSRVSSLAINTLVLTLLYKWLPPRFVSLRGAVRGGLLGAILWEAGRWVLATYLIGGRYSGAYDVVGSFIALMLWIYYAAAVIFYAAEFVQAHEADRRVPPAVPAGTPDDGVVLPLADDGRRARSSR